MEGLGDARFRIALAANGKGGFDEACREFIRVPGTLPNGADPEKLLRRFVREIRRGRTFGYPSGGTNHGERALVADARGGIFDEGEARASRRFELRMSGQCRYGKRRGGSLLRDPEDVYACVKAVVDGAREAIRT